MHPDQESYRGQGDEAADDPAATDPLAWPGLNLLGFALMVVREELAGGASPILPGTR